MGLEALEKPLADAIGIPHGVEEVSGQCEKCGAPYTRRKTVLAGVRGYVINAPHPETAKPERKQEWREINEFRQKLFHSLLDSHELEQKASRVMPAAMHHLHDAVCCLSHEHSLESNTFKLVRRIRRLVFVGRFRTSELGPLEQWRPLVEAEHGYWVKHPQHGYVPRFSLQSNGLKDLEGSPFWLNASLGSATKEDLVPANLESSRSDSGS